MHGDPSLRLKNGFARDDARCWALRGLRTCPRCVTVPIDFWNKILEPLD